MLLIEVRDTQRMANFVSAEIPRIYTGRLVARVVLRSVLHNRRRPSSLVPLSSNRKLWVEV
jgi:hypothetical protein